MKKYYCVAYHTFAVDLADGTDVLNQMGQYAPFEVDATDKLAFSLRIVDILPVMSNLTIEINQDDDGSQILAGNANGKPYFEFQLWGKRAARMLTDSTYKEAVVSLENNVLFGINNALMVLYALSTSCHQTVLFHSSVVSFNGYGYMFLGKSGTGKSTHSGLWLKYIKNTELVNDDNPVVRRMPDGFYVFGSPWSGKTPCYRNISYPLRGIVLLNQAPHNEIRRLRPLEAYAALMASISGKRWDKQVAEGLHETESKMAGEVAVWHLDCLPDEAAARVCNETISTVTP